MTYQKVPVLSAEDMQYVHIHHGIVSITKAIDLRAKKDAIATGAVTCIETKKLAKLLTHLSLAQIVAEMTTETDGALDKEVQALREQLSSEQNTAIAAAKAIATLQHEVESLRAKAATVPAIQKFAANVFESFWCDGEPGDLDGFFLQDAACDAGLLTRVEVPEDGCGPRCNCIDNGAGEGDTCYRITDACRAMLAAAPAPHAGENGGGA